MLCVAKQPFLLSLLFSLLSGNDNSEKREERKNKSEKNKKKRQSSFENCRFFLVGAGGFEPPKSSTTDLQSAPFGHSGTLPHKFILFSQNNGAGGRT